MLAACNEKPASQENAGPPIIGKKFVTAPSGLRMRREPNTASERMRLIPLGSEVGIVSYSEQTETIDGVEAPWARVRFEGITGWVYSGFLSLEKP